ncbi:MAG TPA: pyridoxamine 5'-phosphate oxidase family protein [Acidimicrobiia bacterium]|nr:pyridoxamine 5'-phosphate oxidase family protein [Acidimicrobiia bacterium]
MGDPLTSQHERARLEELDRDECMQLLAGQTVGRIAVAEPGRAPHVVPVNFTLVDGSIVFRTGPGTKLDLLATEPVSFQVDSVDPLLGAGWSVLVQGFALRAPEEQAAVDELRLETFAPGPRDHWVRIVPDVVSGRRVRLTMGHESWDF